MKILEFIIGGICVLGCTVIFMGASLLMYLMTLPMVICTWIRRKGKLKTELNELNKMFINNMESYFHKYL